jgi:hypothetical protein
MPQRTNAGWQELRERLSYPRSGLLRWFLRALRRS